MNLPELCIKRPVFATVLSLSILLIGLISYSRLSVREYPRIDEPVVSLDTFYKGASADVVESTITKPLEDALSGIEGVDSMTSQTRAERSQINIKFKLTRDPDSAAADVRDKVARTRGRLPDDASDSVVAKVEADADPIMFISFYSDKHTALEVSDYANRYIKPRLSTLPGAADVRIFGERKMSMRIGLDRSKLAAYKLGPADVEDALRRQNVEVPAGRIEGRDREFSVLAQTDMQTPEQFNNIIVKDATGYLVRLRDVAKVEIAAIDERSAARYLGRNAATLAIIKQATANPLELSVAVRTELAEIQKALPPGMALIVGSDTSRFIEQSIKDVFGTIWIAVLLVAIVIFLFLRNLRASIIPLVTIPVSLIGSFALMYLFNFSINTLTLLAMVLSIGLVVDDAIVVLENIYRNLESGMSRIDAAIKGSREIAFAVVAMTLTLAAVYAPLAFATGRSGRLFIEFALALAGAVLVSGFVALTLTPMLCSQILRHGVKHGKFYNAIEMLLLRVTEVFRSTLTAVLNKRAIGIALWWVFALLAIPLFLLLNQELAPLEDRGLIFGFVTAPEGATVAYTENYVRQIEEFYKQIPEMEGATSLVGNPTVANATAVLRLKPWNQRTRTQHEIVRELVPKFRGLAGVTAFASGQASLGQGGGKPLQFVIMTSASYVQLEQYVDRLMAEAATNPGLIDVDSDLRLNKPELKVAFNRDKIADVGSNVEAVGRTLETMLGGRQVTRFKLDGEQYDVIVQVADVDRSNPDDITNIYVRSRNNEMVQLSNLLSVRESVSPRSLNHFNKLRAARIDANLAPGYAIKDAIDFMKDASKRALPPTVQNDLFGQSREYRDSSGSIYLTFMLALAFIYLVLSAQFESFVDPFVIMLTVPLAMTGGLLALVLSGCSLNIFSQIGLITLVGLITKHGILIVEFANQLQERGLALREAVIESATLRLRPILMTTGAMVLGAIPLAMASGAGAESRQAIGWVIVGGMSLGTILTLFIVPTFYTFLARSHQHALDAAGRESQPA